MKFYPYKKGGRNFFLPMPKGGGSAKSVEVVLTRELMLRVLAILKEREGVHKNPSLKRAGGGGESYTLSWLGSAKVSDS